MTKLAERFMAEHVTSLKPRTQGEYGRLITKVLLPRLKHLRADAVKPRDVAALHHSLKSTPTEANRALAVLSKMLSWAETAGIRAPGSNPCRGTRRYRETKRERFLAPTELARLAGALTQAEADQPVAVAALRLLIFTGCRLSEILTLKWDHVDAAAHVLRLPDSKTGAKTIYLNAPARAVLASLPKVSGNPYVLPGRRVPGPDRKAKGHFVGLNHVWIGTPARPAARGRKAQPARPGIRTLAMLPKVRVHDLRHSFASVAVSAGASLPLIGGLLGHADPKTTQRYAHLAESPLSDLAERVGARIASAMKTGAK